MHNRSPTLHCIALTVQPMQARPCGRCKPRHVTYLLLTAVSLCIVPLQTHVQLISTTQVEATELLLEEMRNMRSDIQELAAAIRSRPW